MTPRGGMTSTPNATSDSGFLTPPFTDGRDSSRVRLLFYIRTFRKILYFCTGMKEKVKIALIGLGQRGLATLRRYMQVQGADIVALCDIDPSAVAEALAIHPACPFSSTSRTATLSLPDVDLIYVCTDWATHAEIAADAMIAGKDVAVEVPVAPSIAEGRHLLDVARTTGRRFTMMENCCYDPFALSTRMMADAGVLGDITHCEGAYIHDLRNLYSDKWYGFESSRCAGNPYPTHGIGPICQLLGIGRTDRFTHLVSMSAGCGINSTIIHTELGRTVLLQYDVTTPRPYSRLQTTCGTSGYASKYPLPTVQIDGQEPLTGQALDAFLADYTHPWVKKYEADALRLGVDNLMNYIMDRRLIDCLLADKNPDITPEDAVLWSAIAELTHLSASQGSRPVEIPDFYV